MRTRFLTLAVLAGTGILLASSSAATAGLYDFTFTSGGMNATGTIDIENGVAQGGSINVTGIPIEHPVAGDPTALTLTGVPLLPGSGAAQNHNGDNLPYDNMVNFGNDPILTGNGLDFVSGQYDATHYNTLIGLWGGDANGNGTGYTLFVGEAGLHADGTFDREYVYNYLGGSLTITAVPEPSTCGVIAGVGLLAVSLRNQFRRKTA